MKTLIAVPCMDTVPVPFMESILNLTKPADTRISFLPGSLVYDSRNMLSLKAIEDNYDYVMWFDSDMVFPHDTLLSLMEDLDRQDAQIVTGLYFKRKFNTSPVLYRVLDKPQKNAQGIPVRQLEDYIDYPKDTIFPVQGAGFGCMLMETSVLKQVWDTFGPAFAPLPWGGEDISFCYRVKQLGIPILCDSRVKCGHVGSMQYNEAWYDMIKNGGDAHG